jgi:hypothetical protein
MTLNIDKVSIKFHSYKNNLLFIFLLIKINNGRRRAHDVTVNSNETKWWWILRRYGVPVPQVADGGDGLHIWWVVANILNKQSRTEEKSCPRIWGLGVRVTTPYLKT